MDNELEYLKRRAEEALEKAVKSSDNTVTQTHEKFAAAYAERIVQANIARTAVDELLG